MNRIIHIDIRNKIAKAKIAEEYYICGNKDFKVVFDFDDDWEGYERKTARFSYEGKYEDVVFEGNECFIPYIIGTRHLDIGVFVDDASSTPVRIRAKESIVCGEGLPEDPTDDVYTQLLNSMKEPYIGDNGNWFVWDMEAKDFVDSGVRAEVDEEALEGIENKLDKHIEDSTIYNTASGSTGITDINFKGSGIKQIDFYGFTSQPQGATLSHPKTIEFNGNLDTIHCCGYKKTYFKGYLGKQLFATNKYRDSGWVDLVNNKIHYKRFIKRIVLDGSEHKKYGKTVWTKQASIEGAYYANLHYMTDVISSEDLERLNNQIPITYNDGLCNIGSKYVESSTPKSDGEFRVSQGYSASVNSGYLRFQIFSSNISSLDELLDYLQKNPITLFVPMIYDVYEDELDCEIPDIIKNYGDVPFTLYFDNAYIGNTNIYPTDITYEIDVGLAMQNMKNAIIALGGNV